MVGTGVFTSLGYQLVGIQSAGVILLLWALGGVIALCGALSYAELGAALPRSGGEYHFLGQIYHPAAGFISGLISVSVGFSAPTAMAAITAATYLRAVWPDAPVTWIALALVWSVAFVHMHNREGSSRLQQTFTLLKVALILVFAIAAFVWVEPAQPVDWGLGLSDVDLIGSGAFAVALIYVTYAYTGWNAATYLISEIEAPEQRLPRILIIGTAVVALLYLLLHIMFLTVAPMQAYVGKIEVGYVAAEYAFGGSGSVIVGIMLAVLLVSTVSAMLLAGPRALQVIGQDIPAFRFLAQTRASGVPHLAVLLQTALTTVMIITASFESILLFSGAVLALNSTMTVLGVWVLRRRQPDLPRPFRMPWYPLPMLIYAAISIWTLVHLLMIRPEEAGMAILLIVLGGIVYWLSNKVGRET
ncbi:MAG TPA: amino acid permease [Gammaproteobacteria bacterium]|nr:amino acid permease [Gammaproteobacteria bacterium]